MFSDHWRDIQHDMCSECWYVILCYELSMCNCIPILSGANHVVPTKFHMEMSWDGNFLYKTQSCVFLLLHCTDNNV